MNTNLNVNQNIFSYLPEELIVRIIGYNESIVFRNGKYINRLDKKDVRYKIIKSIPKPIYFSSNRFIIWFTYYNRERIYHGYSMYYEYTENKMYIKKMQYSRSKYGVIQSYDSNYF
jgi:hypothetical protein